MKYLIIVLLSLALGCQKSSTVDIPEVAGTMTVVIDCTGSYLQYNSLDYMVCNRKMLEGFENGKKVKASFKKLKECTENQPEVCKMYHANEGWIQVISIK